ncbi:MAG: hypothetical protein AB1632_00050 [Nitrospirota bacterium]
MIPFLSAAVSALILGNSGRTLREKFTIFFISPKDIDKDNLNIASVLRFVFWVSLIVSIWMITTICRRKGSF